MTAESSCVRVEDGPHQSRVLTLARPERRNALSGELIAALYTYLRAAQRDPSVRSIVLAADGPVFCAGGDFSQMPGQGGPVAPTGAGRTPDYADLLSALVTSEVPVIARLQGDAFGGGLGLAAASTFAIAAESARFGTPEIRVGIFPMMIAAVLVRVVPRRTLSEMMLFGEPLSAREAQTAGLITLVVNASALDDTAHAYAERVQKTSPSTVRLGLRALAEQDGLRLDAALPLLKARLLEVLATDDAREGLTAFLEKRAPVWRGT